MPLRNLLLENRAWVEEKLQVNPEYFKEISKDQTPQYLWIGCSDSRVNPSEITGTSLGEMFVHRNIANLVRPDDLNLMSVITYGVEYLKVKHIIICGHYGCGGVIASMTDNSFGIIDGWLATIKKVIASYKSKLDALPEGKLRTDQLVELNVIEQAKTLSQIDFIAKHIKDGDLKIHGWVYSLNDGLLKDLITINRVD